MNYNNNGREEDFLLLSFVFVHYYAPYMARVHKIVENTLEYLLNMTGLHGTGLIRKPYNSTFYSKYFAITI